MHATANGPPQVNEGTGNSLTDADYASLAGRAYRTVIALFLASPYRKLSIITILEPKFSACSYTT